MPAIVHYSFAAFDCLDMISVGFEALLAWKSAVIPITANDLRLICTESENPFTIERSHVGTGNAIISAAGQQFKPRIS